MATKPFNKNDFRTLDKIKNGFINGVFKTPEEIVKYLEVMFGDGKITLHKEPTNKSFMVEVVSLDFVADKYSRAFRFHYEERDNEYNKLIGVEELN